MSNNTYGFFITKLAVFGPGKSEAILDFADGLNVISGASDTGKSFALSCIDFTFGARDAPRSIPEVEGYQTVSLILTARATLEQFEIERGLAGGDVRITRRDKSGKILESLEIPFKHNASNPKTLSGVLLELSGLWGRQVRKNAKGERRSLSFRDIAYLCVVDEERIIAERPPHLSDSFVERTVESEAFRLLITGNESGEVIVVPGKEDIAGIDAKLELIESMIEKGLAEVKKTGLQERELENELTEIDQMRGMALEEYERSRVSVTELEGGLREQSHVLREAQSRNSVVEGLINKFRLLDEHYDSSIKRLVAVEETGLLLESLPSKPCPICGALPEFHLLKLTGKQCQLSNIYTAAQIESGKIVVLKNDLSRVINELDEEHHQLAKKVGEAANSLKNFQEHIDGELMPRIKESAQVIKSQTDRRDFLLRAKAKGEELAKLRVYASDLEKARVSARSSSPRVATTATSAEMDAFANAVESVLVAWRYPNPGRVIFSEDNQDLVIGGNSRASHGKGVRALTCAAFIIGAMRHCRSTQLSHPYIVALDSPLVAYREPDATDSELQRLRQAGVKEAFYSELASGIAGGQVIVFENEDPPPNLAITRHHFTKTNVGRYGFFPQN